MEQDIKFTRIPEVGEKLPSFDDGKVRESRLYNATVTKIIPFEEAKDFIVDDLCHSPNDDMVLKISLQEAWEKEKEIFDWLFADTTECFIECDIQDEVANPNYFARMKNGKWFSMGLLSFMQGQMLDTDKSLYKNLTGQDYSESL